MPSRFTSIFPFVVCFTLATNMLDSAEAALTFDVQIQADFEARIYEGGPLDPGDGSVPTGIFLPLQAFGILTFTLDDSDPEATSWAFTDVTGQLSNSLPFDYYISPTVFNGGTLENIARDGQGNIISGDVTGLSMQWDLIANPGTAQQLDFFTFTTMEFNGPITGTPFGFGNVLAGPSPLIETVHQRLGDGSQGPAGFDVQNRFLTAVPEPSSFAFIAGITAVGAAVRRRRHARQN